MFAHKTMNHHRVFSVDTLSPIADRLGSTVALTDSAGSVQSQTAMSRLEKQQQAERAAVTKCCSCEALMSHLGRLMLMTPIYGILTIIAGRTVIPFGTTIINS